MHRFIYDRYAAIWRPDGLCELYLADVTTINELRVHDLARIGLPEDTMRALWREAHTIITKADLTGVCELVEQPLLLWIYGGTGAILDRWEAQDPWEHVLARLREVDHAA